MPLFKRHTRPRNVPQQGTHPHLVTQHPHTNHNHPTGTAGRHIAPRSHAPVAFRPHVPKSLRRK